MSDQYADEQWDTESGYGVSGELWGTELPYEYEDDGALDSQSAEETALELLNYDGEEEELDEYVFKEEEKGENEENVAIGKCTAKETANDSLKYTTLMNSWKQNCTKMRAKMKTTTMFTWAWTSKWLEIYWRLSSWQED